jgi:hypothetical protein
MALPPDESETDVSMLEVVTAGSIVGTLQTPMEHEQLIVVADDHHQHHHRQNQQQHQHRQEEFTTRPSRESILKRLSEALLRHSLAKVRFVVSVVVVPLNLTKLQAIVRADMDLMM